MIRKKPSAYPTNERIILPKRTKVNVFMQIKTLKAVKNKKIANIGLYRLKKND